MSTMKMRRLLVTGGLVVLALLGWVSFGMWQPLVEEAIWPVPIDENGIAIYERVGEAPVRPYPKATTVRLVLSEDGGRPPDDREGRELSDQDRRAFGATLIRASERYSSGAACFVPHHFFRYYDAEGALIGEIAVCFCCHGASAYPALFPATGGNVLHPYDNRLGFDEENLAALIESWGLPVDLGCR